MLQGIKKKQNKKIYLFECMTQDNQKVAIQANRSYVKKQKVKVLKRTYLYTID